MRNLVPPAVQTYLDGIAVEHRPMWDRVEGLVRVVHPDVELLITYGMPTFVVGNRRLDRSDGRPPRHPDTSRSYARLHADADGA